LFGGVVLGHLAHTPATWVLLGIAVALYGLAPRLVALTWAVFAYSSVLSLFGDMLQLDEAVLATSVLRRVGQYPAEGIAWTAVGGLALLAAGLVAVGTAGCRRRDLITA